MKRRAWISVLVLVAVMVFAACSRTEVNTGMYRSNLILNQEEQVLLPFELEVTQDENQQYTFTIINDQERIEINEYTLSGRELTFKTPVFASFFQGIVSEDKIEGYWYNHAGGDTVLIPWKAYLNKPGRFDVEFEPALSVAGKWEVRFGSNPAIGEFFQEGSKVTGTFMTETGDYRFLEGVLDGNRLRLSAFDGAHAFLFEADLHEGDSLRGTFYSGKSYKTNWHAVRNEEVELTNPYELTYLKAGYSRFTFAFPDENGDTVSLEDPRFQNKVVMVQIMGSWCPNCMEESELYAGLYKEYREEGLEIVALGFEKVTDPESVQRNFDRLRERFDIQYPILLAGTSSKRMAAEALPMLNHVLSYPTTIYVDREGQVRKIHTGFYGKNTGEHYTQFVDETKAFIEMLLAE